MFNAYAAAKAKRIDPAQYRAQPPTVAMRSCGGCKGTGRWQGRGRCAACKGRGQVECKPVTTVVPRKHI